MEVSVQSDAQLMPRAAENNLALLVLLLDFSKDRINSSLAHTSEIQGHFRPSN